MISKLNFYFALFLVTGSTLLLQLIQTRILSTVTWYHLAFFVISMAMFGLTAGAIFVYFDKIRFLKSKLSLNLSLYSMLFSLSLFICTLVQMSLPVIIFKSVASIIVWVELAVCITLPFFFSGIVVSLALTQSPFPTGHVYAVDLMGAGIGAISTILLLDIMDAVSALLFLCLLIMFASILFKSDFKPVLQWCLVLVLLICTILNNSVYYGLQPIMSKGNLENGSSFEKIKWNSFSRVTVSKPYLDQVRAWGFPTDIELNLPKLEFRDIKIDADAGTWMQKFSGDQKEIDYLKLDQVNLGYHLPDRKKVAVIGIGGGRDILSAKAFGIEDITGIEINPIIVNFLNKYPETKNFINLHKISGLKIFTDDGRSWMARTKERFDLIQMSLVDTWAATSAGAFSLSENALYTVEGWETFITKLSPQGILSVSRWFGGDSDETSRLLSLAFATLYELGVKEPRKHVFMSVIGKMATIIISKSPLSLDYIQHLEKAIQKNGYSLLLSPIESSLNLNRMKNEVISSISKVNDRRELDHYLADLDFDLTPPTDNRPFFFNQLPFKDPLQILRLTKGWLTDQTSQGGIRSGNFVATGVLLILFCIATVFVLGIIIFPISVTKNIEKRFLFASTAYFLLIGIGFIFIEISLLQRMNIFLGHPIYSLSIVLFTLILFTGLGSFLSNKFPINLNLKLMLWIFSIILVSITTILFGPSFFLQFAGKSIMIRGLICVLFIIPIGILLGFGFPTGMSLVSIAGKDRLTPWLWGINGAGGVLGSIIAVILSIGQGINFTFLLGAICYLLLVPSGIYLIRKAY